MTEAKQEQQVVSSPPAPATPTTPTSTIEFEVTFRIGAKTGKLIDRLAKKQDRTRESLCAVAFKAGLDEIKNMYSNIDAIGPPKYGNNANFKPGPRSSPGA